MPTTVCRLPELDPFARHCLLNGFDEVALTLEHEDAIAAYEARAERKISTLAL